MKRQIQSTPQCPVQIQIQKTLQCWVQIQIQKTLNAQVKRQIAMSGANTNTKKHFTAQLKYKTLHVWWRYKYKRIYLALFNLEAKAGFVDEN